MSHDDHPARTHAPELGQDVLFGIAQLALEKIDGVRALAPTPRVGEFLTGRRAKGIRIERDGDVVDVEMNLTVRYGLEIPVVAQQVRKAVREAIGSMTGLHVRSVRICVVGVDLQRPEEFVDRG
ncbi:MAG: Asp23/Gls24 family envelope stress response protein [Trueperaceae bacterium]